MEKIEIIQELLDMAKKLKADYAEIVANTSDYKSFKFTWEKSKQQKN